MGERRNTTKTGRFAVAADALATGCWRALYALRTRDETRLTTASPPYRRRSADAGRHSAAGDELLPIAATTTDETDSLR